MLSINSCLKHQMPHDGTWGTSFEMLLTSLLFDIELISLANKPGRLWPYSSKVTVDSYTCTLAIKYWEGKELFSYIYCHALHDPLTAHANKRHLNYFAFLMPSDLNASNIHKLIYFGDIPLDTAAEFALKRKLIHTVDEKQVALCARKRKLIKKLKKAKTK